MARCGPRRCSASRVYLEVREVLPTTQIEEVERSEGMARSERLRVPRKYADVSYWRIERPALRS